MSLPARFAPSTQLDALRTLLSQFREDDRAFQAQLERSLQGLRQLALPEFGRRLAPGVSPPALRRGLLRALAGCGWPALEPLLAACLRTEDELDLFSQALEILGGCTSAVALQAMEELKRQRPDPERQLLLDRELARYRTEKPFAADLDALMAGALDPERCRQGACGLAAGAGPEQLPELQDAFRIGDPMARALLLRLIGGLPGSEATAALLALLGELLANLRDTALLVDFLAQIEALPGRTQREELLVKAGLCFGEAGAGTLASLRARMVEPARAPEPDLGPLRAEARGPLLGFLLQGLELLAAGKILGFSSLVHTAHLDTVPVLRASLHSALDDLAALLASRVETGRTPLEEALPALAEAYHAGAGGQGLRVAYLRLLPSADSEGLERLLAESDPERRRAALDVLGAREDDRLAPFFLKAMGDPVREVGTLAIHQLGKLPSGQQGMLELFRSGEPDRVREAVRFFAENHTKEAVKPLMAFLGSEGPDDLMVDAATALGNIADPTATGPMLRQLHAGKPLALQLAIAEALTRLQTTEASLGLLKKSEELTLPEVLLASLQGAIAAFPGFEQPFPPEQVAALEHLVERCCDPREGAGHWLSAAVLLEDLFVFDAGLYERFLDRFSASLADLRRRPNYERRSHDRIAEVVKKLSRRAAKLSSAADRERHLQAALEGIPAGGSARQQVLLRVRDGLEDAEQVLGEAWAGALGSFLERELSRADLEFSELDLLCGIASRSGLRRLVPPLEDLMAHAGSAAIRDLARRSLLALGLSEAEIDRRKPIRSVLLMEPSAFFRHKLETALAAPERTVAAVADRAAAESTLTEGPVDLLVSETHDGAGELWDWLTAAWERRAFRYLLLSTSDHEPGPLTGQPWLIGRLLKPYPPERLTRILAD